MKEELLRLFHDYPQYALAISLLISILIAIMGLVPSIFITAANILFFGLWEGMLISFAGEAVGALCAFMLYRKGFKNGLSAGLHRFPKVQRLLHADQKESFSLIFSLRLLPFVPSGLITFAAAIGNVSVVNFLIASSLGKIPALLIEGFSVYQLTRFGTVGKILLVVTGILIVLFVLRSLKKKSERVQAGD